MTVITAPGPRSARVWAGLVLVAAAAIVTLKVTGAIDRTTAFILFAVSMGLLLPMVRAMTRQRAGCSTVASVGYWRRMVLFGSLYALDLGIAIAVDEAVGVRGWFTVLFALLPTLPILGMIWAMGRYLVDETDEFLRHRAALAALIGLGVLLAVSTFVGFLERFGLNLHPEGWFALPVWAMGMCIGQAWMARGDRMADRG
jgi:hypothetical protein